jgi:hypothetical protein
VHFSRQFDSFMPADTGTGMGFSEAQALVLLQRKQKMYLGNPPQLKLKLTY